MDHRTEKEGLISSTKLLRVQQSNVKSNMICVVCNEWGIACDLLCIFNGAL